MIRQYQHFTPQGFRDGWLCGTISLKGDKQFPSSMIIATAEIKAPSATLVLHITITRETFAKMKTDEKRWKAVFNHARDLARGGVMAMARYELPSYESKYQHINFRWGK